jgi:hypothetical protein
MSDRQIADELGVSNKTVGRSTVAGTNDTATVERPHHKPTPTEIARRVDHVLDLWKTTDATPAQIAQAVGVGQSAVFRDLVRAGLGGRRFSAPGTGEGLGRGARAEARSLPSRCWRTLPNGRMRRNPARLRAPLPSPSGTPERRQIVPTSEACGERHENSPNRRDHFSLTPTVLLTGVGEGSPGPLSASSVRRDRVPESHPASRGLLGMDAPAGRRVSYSASVVSAVATWSPVPRALPGQPGPARARAGRCRRVSARGPWAASSLR